MLASFFLALSIALSFLPQYILGANWSVLENGSTINPVWKIFKTPTEWDVKEKKNLKWVTSLGSQTYATPVISNGMVFIGTNNDSPRDSAQVGDQGVLMVFRESDGKFLWQATSEKLPSDVNDWPHVGISSTPLVKQDRLYYVTNRCEVVCLDTQGFLDGENDGPFKEEKSTQKVDADVVWKLDMIQQLGVFPHNTSNSSPVGLGDLIFIGTSNGQNGDHTKVPAPQAPTIVALDQITGDPVWMDNSPGNLILNGQWASPIVGQVEGVNQVIMGQGDGWVRSYEALTGQKLWEFDTNPPDSVYPRTRNSILATPLLHGNYVYIANGQDPENGEGKGHLYCIDATKRGDITKTGLVWHQGRIRRSLSTPAIYEGLIYCPDFSGFLHCLDAKTGYSYWTHDTFAAIWGSPTIVNGHIYLGDEDGDIVILKTGKTEQVVAEINMGDPVYSMPVISGRNLFISTSTTLFAVSQSEEPETLTSD